MKANWLRFRFENSRWWNILESTANSIGTYKSLNSAKPLAFMNTLVNSSVPNIRPQNLSTICKTESTLHENWNKFVKYCIRLYRLLVISVELIKLLRSSSFSSKTRAQRFIWFTVPNKQEITSHFRLVTSHSNSRSWQKNESGLTRVRTQTILKDAAVYKSIYVMNGSVILTGSSHLNHQRLIASK